VGGGEPSAHPRGDCGPSGRALVAPLPTSDEPAVQVLAVGRILDVSATERLAATGPAHDWDALCLALETLVARAGADLVPRRPEAARARGTPAGRAG
jgi:hypothetical protein